MELSETNVIRFVKLFRLLNDETLLLPSVLNKINNRPLASFTDHQGCKCFVAMPPPGSCAPADAEAAGLYAPLAAGAAPAVRVVPPGIAMSMALVVLVILAGRRRLLHSRSPWLVVVPDA